MKRYEERLKALEAWSKDTTFWQRIEVARNSPMYQRVAEYIKGLPDSEKAEVRKKLLSLAHL